MVIITITALMLLYCLILLALSVHSMTAISKHYTTALLHKMAKYRVFKGTSNFLSVHYLIHCLCVSYNYDNVHT